MNMKEGVRVRNMNWRGMDSGVRVHSMKSECLYRWVGMGPFVSVLNFMTDVGVLPAPRVRV